MSTPVEVIIDVRPYETRVEVPSPPPPQVSSFPPVSHAEGLSRFDPSVKEYLYQTVEMVLCMIVVTLVCSLWICYAPLRRYWVTPRKGRRLLV